MENPPFSGVTAPRRTCLAFAIALVKHKPPDKEVKDYILELRHFIRDGLQVESSDKFFDSVAFWQQAYRASEAEQARLLNKVFELEQRTQGLRSKIKESQNARNAASPSSKRKVPSSGSLQGLDPPRKKAQSRASQFQLAKNTDNEADENSDNENAPKLMRQLHTVQRALQKRNNSKTLTTDAVTLCKIAESEILGTIIRFNTARTRSKIPSSQKAQNLDLVAVTKAAELAFSLAHQALRKVIGTQEEAYCKSQIIYYLVCLFESTMNALTQLCTTSTRTNQNKILRETSDGNEKNAGSRANSQIKKVPMVRKYKETKFEKNATQLLLDLLCTMTLSLDLARNEDQEVMEGFLFIAIYRVGKMLALFVFKDHLLSSDSCSDLEAPQGIRAMKDEGLTQEFAQLEAEHLIRFLDKVLGPRISDTEIMRSKFIQNMNGRLQKTLMHAVFGDDDPLFREGLSRPVTPPPLSNNGQSSARQEFPEWFTEELWRLIGWDMLSSIVEGGQA